jgi:hypothetical protein
MQLSQLKVEIVVEKLLEEEKSGAQALSTKVNKLLEKDVRPQLGVKVTDLIINRDFITVTALEKISFKELGLEEP